MFSLSVVNIVPDNHKDAINQIAELYGCGSNNLSVKLQDAEGNVFWGCHSWRKPEDYAEFTDSDLRSAVVPVDLQPALEHLYERLELDGDSMNNWNTALTELDLTTVLEDEVANDN